jgi:diguanylate cyclase (GGDEF)-like protein/PAS domain S-box-containing protein
MEASSDAIYTIDITGIIVTWNRGAERLFGYPADQALGHPNDVLFPVHLRGKAWGLLSRVLAGEPAEQVETEIRRRDGMLVPVSLSLSPIGKPPDHIAGATAVARDVTEQNFALTTLAESEAKLLEAQALAHIGIWVWDSTAATVQWSEELYRIHDVDPMDYDGSYAGYLAFVAPEDRQRVDQALHRAVQEKVTLEDEYQVLRPNGERRWVYVRAEPATAVGLVTTGLRGICQDITERKQAEEGLRLHAGLLGLLQRIATAANEAQSLDEALRACLQDVCAHGDWPLGRAQFVSSDPGLHNELWHTHPAGSTSAVPPDRAAEIGSELAALVRRTHRPVWAAQPTGTVFSFPVLVGREVVAVLQFFSADDRPRDEPLIEAMVTGSLQLGRVNERMRTEEVLSRQALHDALTALPNRTLFLERLGHSLARLQREPGLIAVLFLDLDGFKLVNDSLGHEAGDELLLVVADRLREHVRPNDTVARFGGDEFTILCEDLVGEDDALVIARRVADSAAAPVVLAGGHDLELTASVGIAFSRGAGTPEGLLRDADAAMYRAKEQGPDRCEIFDAALHHRAMHRLATIRALRNATELDQFRLVYQPQVNLADGRILGVEALVRWQHPERGLLGPLEFIGLAEESQLIVPIGEWVIATACRQAAQWRAESAPPLKMSVNVSARQLGHGGLADCIQQALISTGISAASLCLEITENVLMGDADFYLEALLGLKFLGVNLAVDDFGMGYSSLAYLQRFPVDVLKIDKTFVDGLGSGNSRAQAIPRAVITLARDLGMAAIAEGVETLDQARELSELGCKFAQGYYFARPQSPEAMGELLRRGSLSEDPLS